MNKILIADNDDSIRLLYQLELEDEGYKVKAANNNAKAIMRGIRHFNPDLVILDFRLEKAGDMDILHQIRALNSDLPVILCSTYNFFRNDFKAISSDYLVTKAVDMRDMKAKVRKALENNGVRPKVPLSECQGFAAAPI